MTFLNSMLGFGLFIILVIMNGSTYKGIRIFYKISQGRRESYVKRIAVSLLEGPIARLCLDYAFYKENVNKECLSDRAIEQYSDDSLSGYGDEILNKGGATIQEQQRGLILSVLEKAICELTKEARTIVEIGTGNGDIVAYLAAKYPMHKFVGVDFSIKTAERKQKKLLNLSFKAGYALDLLEQNQLFGDIVFGSSTFDIFSPRELKGYFRLFRERFISQVILNEPVWGGYKQRNTTDAVSNHMEGACWYHNYCGYLREAGYTISDFSFFHYRHPLSNRPDIYVSVIRGTLAQR